MASITAKKIARWKEQRDIKKLELAASTAKGFDLRLDALDAIDALGAANSLPTLRAVFHDAVPAVANKAMALAEKVSSDSEVLKEIEAIRAAHAQRESVIAQRKDAAANRHNETEEQRLARKAREYELKRVEFDGLNGVSEEQRRVNGLTSAIESIVRVLANILRF